jgi:hypothetical protein
MNDDTEAWRGDVHLPDWPWESYIGAEWYLYAKYPDSYPGLKYEQGHARCPLCGR